MGLRSDDEPGAQWTSEDSKRHDAMIQVIREAYQFIVYGGLIAESDWKVRAEALAVPIKLRGPLSVKFGIIHPSDRPLGRNFAGEEVWTNDSDAFILFDTAKEANALRSLRIKEYPASDWSATVINSCTLGRPAKHIEWNFLHHYEEEQEP